MYQFGITQADKDFADSVFRLNMYLKIERKSFLQYSWKCLTKARMFLAELYYDAVSSKGDAAFWEGKKIEKEIA